MSYKLHNTYSFIYRKCLISCQYKEFSLGICDIHKIRMLTRYIKSYILILVKKKSTY